MLDLIKKENIERQSEINIEDENLEYTTNNIETLVDMLDDSKM